MIRRPSLKKYRGRVPHALRITFFKYKKRISKVVKKNKTVKIYADSSGDGFSTRAPPCVSSIFKKIDTQEKI
jgi:hypothetical protein